MVPPVGLVDLEFLLPSDGGEWLVGVWGSSLLGLVLLLMLTKNSRHLLLQLVRSLLHLGTASLGILIRFLLLL